MPIITIPKVIREKLGDDGSEAITELFNEIEEGIKRDNIAIVEEKFERRLSEELGKVRIEIAEIKTGLQREIAEKIAETKTFLFRWMVIFWVGQIGVLTGTLFSFLKNRFLFLIFSLSKSMDLTGSYEVEIIWVLHMRVYAILLKEYITKKRFIFH